MINYLVFDWETSSKNKGEEYVGKPSENGKAGGPSPHHPLNTGVSVGWTNGGEEGYNKLYGFHVKDRDIRRYVGEWDQWYKQAKVLVGHNIRFDLLYTMKHYPEFYAWFWENDIQIWDTQQAEYLLSGQSLIMPTLQKCCERHNLEGKHDEVSEMFKSGIQAQDIDPGILLKYMKQDVLQTEELFLEQYQQAQEQDMLPLIESQMEAMVGTFEMSINGMCFDRELAQVYAQEIRERQVHIAETIQTLYQDLHPEAKAKDVSVGSNDYLSRVLFGGTYNYVQKVNTGEFYKNGNPKIRNHDFVGKVQGYLHDVDVPAKLQVPVKKHGYFEVNDDILNKLKGRDPKSDNIITLVLQYRQNNKDLVTYYQGLTDLAYPKRSGSTVQYFIHGNLNHAVTATGRLSSSKPNLQNFSGKVR